MKNFLLGITNCSRNSYLILITSVVCLHYFCLILGANVFIHRPYGFTLSLIKPIEDVEGYISFFNQTAFGRAIYNLFSSMLGFYYADFLVYGFWVLFSSVAACMFFLFVTEQLSESKKKSLSTKMTLAALCGLSFVFFGRKLYNLSTFLSIQEWFTAHPLIEFLRSIYNPQGTWFTRFYQPGFALSGALLGLWEIERLKKIDHKFWLNGVGLISSVFIICIYPWIALTFLIYLAFKIMELRNQKALAILLCSVACGLTFFLLFGFDKGHSDFLKRISTVQSRLPDTGVFQANLFLLILCLPFYRSRIGKTLFQLQLANVFAILSPVILGYSVQAPHYFHWSSLVLTLWLWCFLEWVLHKTKGVKTTPINLKLIIASIGFLSLLALREQMIWKYRNYFFIPEAQVDKIKKAQSECGITGKARYFFSTDIALYWSIPARSLCQNLIPLGWGDRKLSNLQIASLYLASMLYFKIYTSKSDFLNDLESHLKNLGSPVRELTRNQLEYSLKSRFYYHMMWYLFSTSQAHAGAKEQIRALFEGLDPAQEIQYIKELDENRLILRL